MSRCMNVGVGASVIIGYFSTNFRYKLEYRSCILWQVLKILCEERFYSTTQHSNKLLQADPMHFMASQAHQRTHTLPSSFAQPRNKKEELHNAIICFSCIASLSWTWMHCGILKVSTTNFLSNLVEFQ